MARAYCGKGAERNQRKRVFGMSVQSIVPTRRRAGQRSAARADDKQRRAGLSADWGIADKTGTGDHGVANTIAILRPPARPPLFVAVYFAESDRSPDERNAVHRDVARVIVETM
jgi:beta-lactamase class A